MHGYLMLLEVADADVYQFTITEGVGKLLQSWWKVVQDSVIKKLTAPIRAALRVTLQGAGEDAESIKQRYLGADSRLKAIADAIADKIPDKVKRAIVVIDQGVSALAWLEGALSFFLSAFCLAMSAPALLSYMWWTFFGPAYEPIFKWVGTGEQRFSKGRGWHEVKVKTDEIIGQRGVGDDLAAWVGILIVLAIGALLLAYGTKRLGADKKMTRKDNPLNPGNIWDVR